MQTEGAVGRVVLHLQGLDVLVVLVLEEERPHLSKAGSGCLVHMYVSACR